MKFRLKILLFFVVLYLGNPLSHFLNKTLQKKSFGSDFFKIDKALKDSTEISLWGNSTCFMSFDAQIIQKEFNKSCFNYGLPGAYFDELFHLQAFNERYKNKQIIWIINPFELLKNTNSKINFLDFYLPFSANKQLKNIIANNNFKIFNYFGWNTIFKYTSEHWKFILGGKSRVPFNEFGNVEFKRKFTKINQFFDKEAPQYSSIKIQRLNTLINKIKSRNKLIIIIPPNLSNQDFSSFIKKINCSEIINYANRFNSDSSFQDFIHLNPNEMEQLSREFCVDMKSRL